MYRGQHKRRRRVLRAVSRILAVIGMLIASIAMCGLAVLLMVWFTLRILP